MKLARQRRLWLLERLGALAESSTSTCAVRCAERVDGAHLQRALEQALRRHPVLSVRFGGERGTKLETGGEVGPVELIPVQGQAKHALADWLATQPPLCMAEGPLVRAAVLSAANDTVIVARAHRSVGDCWTLVRLLSEVVSVPGGSTSAEAELELERLERAPNPERTQQAVAAARQHLAACGEPAELSGDRPRPVIQDLRARSSVHTLDARAYDAARALARS